MKKSNRKKSYLVNFANNKNNKGERGNPSYFLFFDTETKQREEIKKIGHKEYRTIINKIDFGWACLWNKETNEEEWRYFASHYEFETFLSYCIRKSKNKEMWIVAHNIVFDAVITSIWDYFKKKKYESVFIHNKGMVFLQKLVKRQKTILKKTGEEKIVTKKSIMLVNNGNIFPTTLKDIGETIGLEKLEMEFGEDNKKYTREEFITYGRRDVEILVEFWRQWIKFIEGNKLGNIKYTISSQSMEAFRKRFCKDFIVLDDDVSNLEFERLSYYGGRTEIFYKGVVDKKIFYFDVNSMYPYVMKNFKYPTEYKFTKYDISIEKMKYYINKGWLVIAECYIETTNNCYPVKQNNTLLFPIGKFKTYLSTPEVIEGIKNDDIKKFGKVQFYHGANIFAEYVEFFYNKRLEMKKAKNKQEKMYKLFLNSLYGKFGQKMDKWEQTSEEEVKMLVPDFNLEEWIMDTFKIPKIIINGLNITPKVRYIGGELQISGEEMESNISFPAIASHVTSYARLIIWTAIKYCQEHNIKYYYCDTDSIFTDKPLPPDIVDDKELGKFKVEKIFENGVEFINLKNYCALNEEGYKVIENENKKYVSVNGETFTKESKLTKGKEWKMKGVSNTATMLDENTFIQQEWGGLPKQEYYSKFGRKSGEFWVIYKEKHNKGTINKGQLQEDGDIKPFVFNM